MSTLEYDVGIGLDSVPILMAKDEFGMDMDGSIIKSYNFTENEYVADLEFSDDNTKLIATIYSIDGNDRSDTIEL